MAGWGRSLHWRWMMVIFLGVSGVAAALTLSPEVQRGVNWLQTKVSGTGTVAGEDASIATTFQNRDEALRTLQLLSSGNAALADKVAAEEGASSEYLARQSLSLGLTGRDVSALLTTLVARQNADGGIAPVAGGRSASLDSAWALAALSQQPAQYSAAITSLKTWLQAQQWTDGGLAGLSDAARLEGSSLMLLAQQALPASLDVRNSMSQLSRWLAQSQSADGSWGGDLYLTAYALAALSPVSADSALQQSAASFLKARQAAAGDWNNDPFITAVILRALAQTSGTALPGSTSVSGQVLSAAGNVPLSGIALTIDGVASSVSSDAQGRFSLGGLASGNHVIVLSLPGYQARSITASVPALGSLDLGVLLLSPSAGANTLSGYVYDVDSQQPLAGATVAIASTPATSVQTDAAGHYQVSNIAAGSFSMTVTAGGYSQQSYTVTVASGSNLLHFKLRKQSNPTPLPTGPATLSGQVVVLGSGQPLPDVQILVNQQAIASSSATGSFSLSLPAGSYRIDYQKAAYLTLTQQVSVTEGSTVTLGTVAMTPQRTTTRLSGVVRDAASQQPLAAATVQVIGGVATTTDNSGRYVLDSLAGTQFDVRASAQGYDSVATRIGVSFPGEASYDFALAAQAGMGVQIAALGVNPASVGLRSDVLITTSYQNTGSENTTLVTSLQLLNDTGTVVSSAVPYANATDTTPLGAFTLAPNERRPVVFRWNSGQFPQGHYVLMARASAAGTISRSNVLGTVLAERQGGFDITAAEHANGSVTATPPVQQAGNTQPVRITALVQNDGNIATSSRTVTARLVDEQSGNTVTSLTTTLPALTVGQIGNVDFGSWAPTGAGSYSVKLLNESNALIAAPARIYIGDAAKGFFTTDKTVVPTGNQIVKGYVALSGVDPVTGEITDPMAPLIKAAIQKAVTYNDNQASAWVTTTGCAGCHIAAQALVGGETNNALATYDQAKRQTVISRMLSIQNMNSGVYDDDPYYKSQTTLGLWGMTSLHDKARYAGSIAAAAKYILSIQDSAGDWASDDPNTGQWWANSVGATALNVESLVNYSRYLRSDAANSFLYEQPYAKYGANINNDCTCALAVDAQKNLYMTHESQGYLEKFSPDGTRTTVMTGLPGMSGVLVRSTGEVLVSSHQNGVWRILPGGGWSRIGDVLPIWNLTEDANGNVFGSSYSNGAIYKLVNNDHFEAYANTARIHHVTAARDGYLYYTTWQSGGAIVRVDDHDNKVQVGTFPIGDQVGNIFQYPDGRWAVSGTAGIYVMTPDFGTILQKVTSSTGGRSVALIDGELVFSPSNSTSLKVNKAVTANDVFPVASIDDAVLRGKNALLAASASYSSMSIQQRAIAMIGLAAAQDYLGEDPAVTARLQALDASLRALQNTDGGWPLSAGGVSDPLPTAQVGYALDRLNPSPDDPVIRNAIQWVLSKQAADGSWHSAQMTTNVAATTWVAIWLPIALNRVGGIDTDLHLSLPANVHLSNPTLAPTDSSTAPDGSSNYHWSLLGVTNAGRNINFDLTLDNLLPNEQRAVASDAHLRFNNSFTNSFTNSQVTAPVAIPVVTANNGLNLSLGTDKASYGANAPVAITAGVGNNGAGAQDGSVHLWVYAQDGTLVSDLGTQNFTGLAPSAQQALNGAWNTATLLPNAYYVQATLYDAAGQQVSTARKDLVIVSSSATGRLLGAQVTTDKGSYGALDTVHVTDRVANLTSNALVGELQLRTQITYTANNQVYWSRQDSLSQLVAGGLKDFGFDVPVANAPAGVYTVSLQVTDSSGAVQAQSSTNYNVFSSASNGVGLGGTLALARKTLVTGETQTISVSLGNQGNAALSGLPVTVSIIDPVSNTVVKQWQDTVPTLAVAGTANLSHTWVTQGAYGRNLVAVLTSGITGTRALAQGVFTLVKPPLTLSYAPNRPLYDVDETATLTSTVVNGVNLALTGLSVVQQVKRPDGTVLWQSTQANQSLAALGTLTRQDALALGRAPAGVYSGTLSVLDAQGVLLAQTTASFEIRSSAVSGAGITGTVTASPAELPQGETAAFGINIGNQGNADLSQLPVSLLVTDIATGTVVKRFDLTVASLLQSTVFTQAFNWAATGTAGTVYAVRLQVIVNGTARQLAETAFKVIASPLKLSVEQRFGGQNRVLVYLSCQPDWHLTCSGWHYGEHNDPCFVTRRTTLRKYLDQLGVPYLIVTEPDDFKREFRSGRYNNYWLLGAVETLSHDVIEEVREAVFRGDSLVVDGGLQRWDNHDIYPMLGVQYRGYLNFSEQKASFTAPVFGASMGSYGPQTTAGKPLFLQPSTGTVTATYPGNKCFRVDFADLLFGFTWHTPTSYAAAVTNTFGKGRTLAFAFDLIGSLPSLAAAPAWTEMMRSSLAYTLPADMQTTALVPGDYQRYSVTVTNQSKAANLVTTVKLPAGSVLVTTKPAAMTNADGSVSYTFTLPENGVQLLETGFRAPVSAGNYVVNTSVRVAGSTTDYGSYSSTIGVQDTVIRASQSRSAISALPTPFLSLDRTRQSQALVTYDIAMLKYNLGLYWAAIDVLSEVGEQLGNFTQTNTTNARVSTDLLLRDWEQQWWRSCATANSSAWSVVGRCGP